MKTPTSNFKHAEYSEQHIIYAGTHIGSLKRIDLSQENPYQQKNLEDVSKLTKGSGITALIRADPEFIVGREDGTIKTFSPTRLCFTSSFQVASAGRIQGLGHFNDHVVAALETGSLVLYKATREIDSVQVCENISRMRQCPTDPSVVAVGGKDRNNNLKLVDLTTKKTTFSSKNLPNDSLDLEVPVWDSDVDFLGSPNLVATCSRYGYVRFYDTRKQRRPVQNHKNDKEQISYTTLKTFGDLIYVGSNVGPIRAFDSRNMKTPVHTYKGFVGSVTSLELDAGGRFLVGGSLDRYVRVYDAKSTALQYQCYAKSKVLQVLLEEVKEEAVSENEEEVPAKSEVDSEYEEIFANMETVKDETAGDEPVAKKRKKLTKKAK